MIKANLKNNKSCDWYFNVSLKFYYMKESNYNSKPKSVL